MGDGFQMGLAAGNALAKGVADWRAIQLDRQNRREFDGAMALAAQRRGMIASATAIDEVRQLEEWKQQMQRSPGAQQVDRPTGNVREDGSPETEQVIRTPEGDIPLAQILQFRMRKQQAETQREIAEVDLIMELQARYPANPYIKQWTASTYAGIQQKQLLRAKQVEAQRLQLDTAMAEMQRREFDQELGLKRDQLQLQRDQFEAAPGRAREQTQFETDERIRGDVARIEAQKGADLEVEGVRAQNKPARPATEFVKKLQQMAPRAQEALEQLDALDIDRTSLASGAESLLPNVAKSGERQQFDQAKLQFVNSVLRAESGATITEAELDKAMAQYFPIIGDSPEAVAQKRKARETAVQELFRAAELEPPPRKAVGAPAAGGVPPEVQSLLDKYK